MEKEKEKLEWGVCSFLWGLVGQREGERDICGTAIPEFISFHFLSGRRRAGPEGDQQLDCTRLPFFPLIISVSTK